MKAVIFAAAKSPRLLPITKDLPISLLKIGKKTILDLQIEVLSKFSFSEIIVVTGFQTEQLKKSLKLSSNTKLFFDPFYDVSNIPATLYLLGEQLKEDFILIYADVLFKMSVVEKLINYKNDIVLVVDTTDKGRVDDEAEKVIIQNNLIGKLDKISIVQEFSNGEFIGLSKFSSQTFIDKKSVLETAIKENLKTSFIQFLNLLIQSGQKINFTEVSNNDWIEIDFPKDLQEAQKFKI